MERLVAGLLLVLLPTAAAIADPAGDVSQRVGGPPIEAPYIDILDASGTLNGTSLDVVMRLQGAVSSAPSGLKLNFIFPFQLGGEPNGTVFGQEDGTIFCTITTGAGNLQCHDTTESYSVTRAFVDGATLGATVLIPEGGTMVAVAAATSQLEDGNVTAQDFTDNALPYASRAPEVERGAADSETSWWKGTWVIVLAAVVGIGGALAWNRYRA